MSEIKHITWLIGSPKAKGSTSEALGAFFTSRFEGVEMSQFQAHKVIRRTKDTAAFLADLDTADLFVVSFPVYVDALPFVLTKTLELIAEHRKSTKSAKSQPIVCIANCGFPEPHHNDLPLAMCRVFAEQTGFQWMGGIGIGAGGTINGTPLEQRGKMTQNYREAFTEAAQQVQSGHIITTETLNRFHKPLISHRLYTGLGAVGWMFQARQRGAKIRSLWQTPYTES